MIPKTENLKKGMEQFAQQHRASNNSLIRAETDNTVLMLLESHVPDSQLRMELFKYYEIRKYG